MAKRIAPAPRSGAPRVPSRVPRRHRRFAGDIVTKSQFVPEGHSLIPKDCTERLRRDRSATSVNSSWPGLQTVASLALLENLRHQLMLAGQFSRGAPIELSGNPVADDRLPEEVRFFVTAAEGQAVKQRKYSQTFS